MGSFSTYEVKAEKPNWVGAYPTKQFSEMPRFLPSLSDLDYLNVLAAVTCAFVCLDGTTMEPHRRITLSLRTNGVLFHKPP